MALWGTTQIILVLQVLCTLLTRTVNTPHEA
jgi:hypothetical protein